MYPSDPLLKIIRHRQAELVREAEACGIPQADPGCIRFTVSGALVVVAVTILLAAARVLIS